MKLPEITSASWDKHRTEILALSIATGVERKRISVILIAGYRWFLSFTGEYIAEVLKWNRTPLECRSNHDRVGSGLSK